MLPSILSKKISSNKALNPQEKNNASLLVDDEIKQADGIMITMPDGQGSQKITGKKYQIYVIEDAKPPTLFPPNQTYTPLPSTVQFSRIVANVITSLSVTYFKELQTKKNSKSKGSSNGNNEGGISEKWTKYLNYKQNKALVSDCFWYAICKFFRKGKFNTTEQMLEKRIADNYIGLFLSIEQKMQNEAFFKEYFNVLSQSVFYSFFYAYPKSRSKFNDDLKDQLLCMFSRLFTGIQISNTKKYYEKWTLDLGTGNILARKPKVIEGSINKQEQMKSLNKSNFPIKPSNNDRTKKRQTLPIRYSPIVQLYLKSHKYKTRNYVSEFKMKYSQNDKNQKEEQEKFAYYRSEANRILQWSQGQKQQEEIRRQQLEAEIKAIKRETINHHKRLDRRKAEELERGAHQYANYLVSMLNAGITMSSLGVVRRNVGS